MRLLTVIPARAGSKTIIDKNMQLLGGKPLIDWTIDIAIAAELKDIIITTDSGEILNHVIQKYMGKHKSINAIMRPFELALDDTPMPPVLLHALNYCNNVFMDNFDTVCCLQPTSPFRSVENIKDCIDNFMLVKELDSIFTCHTAADSALKLYNNNTAIFPDRHNQIFDKNKSEGFEIYKRNGSVFVTSKEVLEKGRMIGDDFNIVLTSELSGLDIDYPWQLELARAWVDYNFHINSQIEEGSLQ